MIVLVMMVVDCVLCRIGKVLMFMVLLLVIVLKLLSVRMLWVLVL